MNSTTEVDSTIALKFVAITGWLGVLTLLATIACIHSSGVAV